MEARFLITDILRAIRDNQVLKTSSDCIVRDFIHPSDFFSLVNAVIFAPATNAVVDAYSKAPIDKATMLKMMQDKFGLRFETTNHTTSVNSTGGKPNYYSLNKHASNFGYQPGMTSKDGLLLECEATLSGV